MKVTTKGRYALRMMVDLAVNSNGACVSLRDVAERQDISMKYMEQIAGLLNKSGFLQSVRGPAGGYRLARAPQEYTAGEILRVTEGCLAPVGCLTAPAGACPRADACPTLPFWEGLYSTVLEYVDSVTLADLTKTRPDMRAEV